MKLELFDYSLPQDRIAQFPLKDRSASRLLVLNRKTSSLEHRTFQDILSFFSKGDVLVLNNTKVLPARLLAQKKTGGKVDLLLVKEIEPHQWEALIQPSRVKGEVEIIGASTTVEVTSNGNGKRFVRFQDSINVVEFLNRHGHMPLPPYIRRKDEASDTENYQTVFAKHEGAIAAPTAGLHFDQSLLEQLRQKGVQIAEVTLHVGLGTFKPVMAENIEDHAIHEEWMEISRQTVDIINEAKRKGNKVIACGTTALRSVESACRRDEPTRSPSKKFNQRADARIGSYSGYTNLYIYPGFQFKMIDGLITNFHLPKTTLLMLVSALAGRETILKAYQEAIEKGYRFFSYGDAMLIL